MCWGRGFVLAWELWPMFNCLVISCGIVFFSSCRGWVDSIKRQPEAVAREWGFYGVFYG